uniref:Uncharacterized protein n=1 Tax=Opuntia streptacantha TaxID=393608 RepID=A0A7C8YG28_OPUST
MRSPTSVSRIAVQLRLNRSSSRSIILILPSIVKVSSVRDILSLIPSTKLGHLGPWFLRFGFNSSGTSLSLSWIVSRCRPSGLIFPGIFKVCSVPNVVSSIPSTKLRRFGLLAL